MKAVLIVAALCLVGLAFAAPPAAAADCDGMGAEGCVGKAVERVTGCNPNYQYFQPCMPQPPLP